MSTPHKNSLDEVSRLKYELQSTQLSVEELQDAISIERQQCLSWMEKHNKVPDLFENTQVLMYIKLRVIKYLRFS